MFQRSLFMNPVRSIIGSSSLVNKRTLRRRKKLIQEVRNQILKKVLGLFKCNKQGKQKLFPVSIPEPLKMSIKNEETPPQEVSGEGEGWGRPNDLSSSRLSTPSEMPSRSSNLFLKKTNTHIKKGEEILNKGVSLVPSKAFRQSTSLIPFYKKMIFKCMHYGHKVIHCDPSMKKYTRSQVNGKHFINLMRTLRYFKKALWFLTKYAYQKKTILFVGTNIVSSRYVERAAVQTKCCFVNVRWLGGMLTNWKTIKNLISKLKKEIKIQQSSSFLDLPKKEIAKRKKEKQRLDKYLRGMKMAKRFPQVVIMTSQPSNRSAAFECQKLGIFNISIVDTNCQKDLADIIIPANDDSPASIRFILYYLSRAILAGKVLWNLKKKMKKMLFGNTRFHLKTWKKKQQLTNKKRPLSYKV
jgi:small subunit ribosomal protein S2